MPEQEHALEHINKERLTAQDIDEHMLADKVESLRAGLFERMTTLSEDASLCFEPFLVLESIFRNNEAFRIFAQFLHQCNSNMDNSLIEMLGFANRMIPMLEKLTPEQRENVLNQIEQIAHSDQPRH